MDSPPVIESRLSVLNVLGLFKKKQGQSVYRSEVNDKEGNRIVENNNVESRNFLHVEI